MIRYLFLLTVSLSLLSCSDNKYDVDISKTKINLKFIHIEKTQNFITNDAKSDIKRLKQKYGTFIDIYNREVLGIKSFNNQNYEAELLNLNLRIDYKSVCKRTNEVYKDVSFFERDVLNAFKRFKVLFPARPIPDTILTYISDLNQSVITTERHIGVGLDKYLGENDVIYNSNRVAPYLQYRMQKKFITPDIVNGWLMKEFPIGYQNRDILSYMLYYGRILYLQEIMLPEIKDENLIYYKEPQYKWCLENEKDIWNNIINSGALFSTSKNDYRTFIGESPFTIGLPPESPGRLGHWIGWRIIKSFMDANSEVTLEKLMMEKDSRKILRLSKYNP